MNTLHGSAPDGAVNVGAPPAPSRVRVIRPQFYRSSLTGSLPPDVRDLLIGLATVADDEGWLLWSVVELATTIYPYASPKRRAADLERRAARLIDSGLLTIEECGCAHLPTLKEHHGLKSGRQTTPVWTWHQQHAEGRGIPRHAAERPVTGSSSVKGSSSGSVVAGDTTDGNDERPTTTGQPCVGCGKPIDLHADDGVRQTPDGPVHNECRDALLAGARRATP